MKKRKQPISSFGKMSIHTNRNNFSKLNLYIIMATTFFLLLGTAVSAFQTSKISEQIKEITVANMPDPSVEKVKIPGLREQVLEHQDVWKCVAPGFVNVITNVVISGDEINMLVDIGGLMKSTDGGKTWKYSSYMLEGGVSAREFFDFDINPANSKCIVIGGNRIYRSIDEGKTWSESYNGLPPLKYFRRGNGYGQVKYNCNGSRLFTSLGTKVSMPVGWEKLLAEVYKNKLIFFSDDNGDSFKSIVLDSPFAVIKKIYPHPSKPDTVYFSFGDGSFYVSHNATAKAPILHKLSQPRAEYFVRNMNINPENSQEMLLTLSSCIKTSREPSFLYKSENCMSPDMEYKKLPVLNKDGNEFKCKDLMTCNYNPAAKGQIVLGEGHSPFLYISDDGGKSFYQYSLPSEFYCDGNLGHFYGSIERVYFGTNGTAVVVSKIGSWITTDEFKNIRNLTMKYDNDYFSNFGVGSPANVNNISICNNNVFFSAQDHGAWISKGNDYMNWRRLTGKKQEVKFPNQPAPWGGEYTWLQHVQKVFASYDEKYVYINCNAMIKKKVKHNFQAPKKFFKTENKGESWEDITPLLGMGEVYPEGSEFIKILFDPTNSSKHWLLMSNKLYYTANGGKTFSSIAIPLDDSLLNKRSVMLSDLCYDSDHNVLYLSVRVPPTMQSAKLNHDKSPAALYRSHDHGMTWDVYNVGQNAIAAIGVTSDGTLAIGTQKTAGQPARLIIIPYGKKYDKSMIKLTAGDTPEEVSANQITISPVICDGKDILAYSNNDWIHSDRFFAQGPLLSRDNGKSFKWINYNLPCTNIWSADIKDGKIMIGTTFGLMYWKFK